MAKIHLYRHGVTDRHGSNFLSVTGKNPHSSVCIAGFFRLFFAVTDVTDKKTFHEKGREFWRFLYEKFFYP